MSTDFRALCAELLDELQYQTDWSTAEELQNRARAALAKPEPEKEVAVIELNSDLFNDDIPDFESMSAPALAVLDAYMIEIGWLDGPTKKDCRCVAATLRAAADQVVPEYKVTPGGSKIWPSEPRLSIRAAFLAIATELDGGVQ